MRNAEIIDPTRRSRVRRRAGRGSYDRAVIHAILDEGLVGHVGIADAEGQPFVIPVIYARVRDELFVHGNPLSRLLKTLGGGARMCLTVTLLDGIVFARSAFHHSVNYRSVVVLGEGRLIEDASEQRAALQAVVEHVATGRSDDVRGPNDKELATTAVVALPLREASAKVRTGPPVDDLEDYALDTWAGVVPLHLAAGEPIADERCHKSMPPYVKEYERNGFPNPA